MRPVLLFDMDGTLIDSEDGIYQSLCHALAASCLPPIRREDAKNFIGPPLDVSLRERLGLYGPVFQQVWDDFAAHYRAEGLIKTVPIPGMTELTARLRQVGFRLAIATCKPWDYCEPTLKLCGFPECFEVISGSFHNGVPEEKAAVIGDALRRLDVSPDQALMIGDRAMDVIGARAHGLPCVGVELCGYAAPGELEEAGAVAVVRSAEELERFLMHQL